MRAVLEIDTGRDEPVERVPIRQDHLHHTRLFTGYAAQIDLPGVARRGAC